MGRQSGRKVVRWKAPFTVVKIDNGFGAAYSASLINRLVDFHRKGQT